jgi:hypothetical protein
MYMLYFGSTRSFDGQVLRQLCVVLEQFQYDFPWLFGLKPELCISFSIDASLVVLVTCNHCYRPRLPDSTF